MSMLSQRHLWQSRWHCIERGETLSIQDMYHFDDTPDNYRAWRSSFDNVVGEVHLTVTQELDLMTKWQENESSERVKRIRSG